jgi:hypothetical protein
VEGRADFPAESSLLANRSGAKSSLLLGALVTESRMFVANKSALRGTVEPMTR